jgi:hypothetical protein
MPIAIYHLLVQPGALLTLQLSRRAVLSLQAVPKSKGVRPLPVVTATTQKGGNTMLGTSLAALATLVVGTCLFMIAAVIVCIGISIFCDTINLGGSFHAVVAKLIAVLFVPILAAAQEIGRAHV